YGTAVVFSGRPAGPRGDDPARIASRRSRTSLLIGCPSCARSVSDRVRLCPFCGARFQVFRASSSPPPADGSALAPGAVSSPAPQPPAPPSAPTPTSPPWIEPPAQETEDVTPPRREALGASEWIDEGLSLSALGRF